MDKPVQLHIKQDRLPLEECLRSPICNVLLCQCDVQGLCLLLQHAFPASVEAASEAGALHPADLRWTLEAALHALRVLASRHAARAVHVGSIHEGLGV